MIGNRIHDMGTNADQRIGGGNAHGIAVYGNSSTSLEQLAITQNELYNLKLGASEAMAINGNVDGFRIAQNIVHDNNNIGIDIIGFEGIAPNPSQDQARNGVIEENHVYNSSSFGNPAYGEDYSAAGIYVDGGKAVKLSTMTFTTMILELNWQVSMTAVPLQMWKYQGTAFITIMEQALPLAAMTKIVEGRKIVSLKKTS